MSKEISALNKITNDKKQPKEKRDIASKYLQLYKISIHQTKIIEELKI